MACCAAAHAPRGVPAAAAAADAAADADAAAWRPCWLRVCYALQRGGDGLNLPLNHRQVVHQIAVHQSLQGQRNTSARAGARRRCRFGASRRLPGVCRGTVEPVSGRSQTPGGRPSPACFSSCWTALLSRVTSCSAPAAALRTALSSAPMRCCVWKAASGPRFCSCAACDTSSCAAFLAAAVARAAKRGATRGWRRSGAAPAAGRQAEHPQGREN